MHDPMPRRRFLVRAAAVAGGLAGTLAGRVGFAGAKNQQIPYYKLSPCSNAGILSKLGLTNPGSRGNNGKHAHPNCQACHACHNHDYNKIMRSRADADQNRAHAYCNCSVYLAGTLNASLWNQLFATDAAVDQRWDWVQAILNGKHL
jgi:hypothetical protein